jgi:hypothetical protein
MDGNVPSFFPQRGKAQTFQRSAVLLNIAIALMIVRCRLSREVK